MKKLKDIALPEFEQNGPSFVTASRLSAEDKEFVFIRQARVRIIMGVCIFALVLFLLISRLAEISMFRTPRVFTPMPSNVAKYRADIVDRNGELLATNLDTYSLYADPKEVWDAVASTEALTAAFPDLDAAIVEGLLNEDKQFVWIKRNLTPRERQAAFALGLPELGFRIEPRRVYPRGRLAAHILGHTDRDLIGIAGAEKAFDAELRQVETQVKYLSLDMRAQFILEDELRAGMEKYKADAASGIVLNVKNGEILALASMPDYDANQPGAEMPDNLLNRASMQPYELGSTFKPVTMALAYETGVVAKGEKLPVQNKLVVRKKSIRDDHPSPVALGIWDVLAKSSNKGSAIIALRAGREKQEDLLGRLGLLSRVPFELHESAAPILPQEWQNLTTATIAYGHGINVTPLALSVATATLLNGGYYIEPTILKRPEGGLYPKRRAVSPEISRTIVDMMRYVVTDGTGGNADISGYEVMGKTGTAEKFIDGAYVTNRLVTSFSAAFPHRDPNYLVFIVYDEPKAAADTYGFAGAGWNAARTAGAVVERIAPILGVSRTTKLAEVEAKSASIGGGR